MYKATERLDMKKILLTTFALAMAMPAYADTVRATITYVEPRYQFRNTTTPVEHCGEVQVPIYGTVQGGNAGEGALLGMIIGGVIGDAVSGGKGDATAGGAIIGGIIGADRAQNGTRQVITGYRTETQCETVYEQTQERTVRDYLITYMWNGIVGQSYTYNNYRVGDHIPVDVSIVAR
jgi:uncharacterized protein YcfJ